MSKIALADQNPAGRDLDLDAERRDPGELPLVHAEKI